MDPSPRPVGQIADIEVEPDGKATLRTRQTPRSERRAIGKNLRKQVPRSALGDWSPPTTRRDPVDQVNTAHEGRLDWLVPIRVGRMVASPYGFLRGTAGLMAEDLSTLPSTGINPVICGDAHVGNFGFYGSPERELVIDLNDFDEAHPGPWEWDLRRLVASIWVAGRQNGFTESQCESATVSCTSAYRNHLATLAERPLFGRSFDRVNLDGLTAHVTDPGLQAEIARAAGRARKRTSDHALSRFTVQEYRQRKLLENPPLTTHLTDRDTGFLLQGLDEYLETLAPHWRRVVSGYNVVDVAHRVVGVGSVALRAYVALCEGSIPDDVLFLQLKQARRSVVAPFVHGKSAWHDHQGRRVAEYQQALQTVSDPLLGWCTVDDRQYYVRQFRNMKGSVDLNNIDASALTDYVAICGRLLAKGHARTSGASLISGYLGSSDVVDTALARFARLYADQTERDHSELRKAVASGRIAAETGI
ncbi:DUF2252 domain-containing protein [Rhodococcus sp. IEGM 1379]|uniref:DUF2252 domain-containing protein n=1 Tax=Rhodococcus sp. IEGM 1379 TaxID=3047086 RepID=UPI0024B7D857|nr:DUF2252 domain-containing protein [Rhodococcus sp. IEGM 1379]MDI9913881.1 DUF2252 domain-containing protein [Rhodococcus sp. IEGM 1379]